MELSRARLAVAAAFASQGLVFISLTTRLNDFQDLWGFSELELSLVILGMVLLAGAGSVAAERLAGIRDSAALLRAGLCLSAVAVVVISTAPVAGVFIGGVAAYGVALGMIDATTNMQAVALEHRYGRPILPSFHGAWTLGGIVGSALTLATGRLPIEVAAGLAVVPLVVMLGPLLPRDRGEAPDAELPAVTWRPILLVGLGMVVFYMVDTAATTWGATYLDNVFTTPDDLVATATLPYLVATLAVRLSGDALVAAHGPVRVLRGGALLACLGLAVVVFAPAWPVAVLGFTITGAGVAVIAPLSFSAAARIAGGSQARVDAVIGRFNQFNYIGALLGAVLTGVVGQDSLRIGFAVPMVLVLAMLPLARAFAPSAPAPSASRRTP